MLGVTCKFPCSLSSWNALLMSRSSSLIAGSINPWVSSYTSLHFLRIPWFTASLSIETYPKEAFCSKIQGKKGLSWPITKLETSFPESFFWPFNIGITTRTRSPCWLPWPCWCRPFLKKKNLQSIHLLGEIKEKRCVFFTWRPKKETVQSKSCNGNRLNDLRKSAVALLNHLAGLVPSINVKV